MTYFSSKKSNSSAVSLLWFMKIRANFSPFEYIEIKTLKKPCTTFPRGISSYFKQVIYQSLI